MPHVWCLQHPAQRPPLRVEVELASLDADQGLWVGLLAAGRAGQLPSVIKAQGPYHGAALGVAQLSQIVQALLKQGYALIDEPLMWRLSLAAERKRIQAERREHAGNYQFSPDDVPPL